MASKRRDTLLELSSKPYQAEEADRKTVEPESRTADPVPTPRQPEAAKGGERSQKGVHDPPLLLHTTGPQRKPPSKKKFKFFKKLGSGKKSPLKGKKGDAGVHSQFNLTPTLESEEATISMDTLMKREHEDDATLHVGENPPGQLPPSHGDPDEPESGISSYVSSYLDADSEEPERETTLGDERQRNLEEEEELSPRARGDGQTEEDTDVINMLETMEDKLAANRGQIAVKESEEPDVQPAWLCCHLCCS